MIFFSAHGVPVAYVEEAGDPYKAKMEECVDLIMEELERRKINNPYTLAYQSRVGPVEWLKPYTDVTIVELGEKGVNSLLVVPIRYFNIGRDRCQVQRVSLEIWYREMGSCSCTWMQSHFYSRFSRCSD